MLGENSFLFYSVHLQGSVVPPSCGFPPQPYPLKGHPRLREDTFGTRAQVLPMRRLSGGAMLCHLQCARFANRRRIAGVRPFCPRHSYGRRLLRLPLRINVRRRGVSRAAQPSVHRRCNRLLNAAVHFRGPRRKYFLWGKLCDLASLMSY